MRVRVHWLLNLILKAGLYWIGLVDLFSFDFKIGLRELFVIRGFLRMVGVYWLLNLIIGKRGLYRDG